MSTQIVISEHDLPTWMKRARRSFNWGVLLVAGFCLLIAWPLIEESSLPRTNDSIHYAFQAHDAAQSLREGRLYPRWSPYALKGLGAPIPHYTPPGASYITALIDLLFTNDTVFAMRIVHILAIITAGVSVYSLVMQRVHAMAGLIAALLYVYSPYVSLTVPHVLGDLPEAIALALLPMLLWVVHRTLRRNKAALLYLPIVSAILFLTSPQHFVLGWLLSAILIIIHTSEFGGWQQIRTIALGLCMGFGVSAFYWLPAFYERNLVHWLPVSNYFLRYHLMFTDLFARTQQLDTGAMRHIPVFNLGWMLLLFVGLSIIWLLLRRGTRFQGGFLIVGIILSIVAIVWFSSATWLFGGVVLCLAIGGSVIGDGSDRMPRWLRYPLFVLFFGLIFGFSLPIWISQSSFATIGNINPIDQIIYEAQTGSVAVLPPDTLYPTSLPNSVLESHTINSDFDPDTSSRFQNTNLAQLTMLEQGIHFARYVVFADAPTTIIYEQAYFPGWRAQLDNTTIPLEAETETGLIELTVPPVTNSTLILYLGTVPIRAAAWIVSYAMLAAALFIVWRRWLRRPDFFDDSPLLRLGDVRLFAVILFIGFVARAFPPLRDSIYQLREVSDYRLQNRAFANNSSDSHLEYQGYTMAHDSYTAGDAINLSLYWEAVRESSDLYQVAIRIRQVETDTIIYTSDLHPPGFYPTALWSTNLYIEDQYQVQIPRNSAPGEYVIEVFMWGCTLACDRPVNFYSPDRQLMGTALSIPIRIR